MAIPTLDQLIALAGVHAENVLVRFGFDELCPSFLIVDGDGGVHIVQTPWANDTEKDRAVVALRAQMRELKAVRYSYVLEAWGAWAPKGFKVGDQPAILPRHDPKREEVVIASAYDGQLVRSATWRIVRDKRSKVARLERDQKETREAFNRFADLLPSTGTH